MNLVVTTETGNIETNQRKPPALTRDTGLIVMRGSSTKTTTKTSYDNGIAQQPIEYIRSNTKSFPSIVYIHTYINIYRPIIRVSLWLAKTPYANWKQKEHDEEKEKPK